jgi:hypothetical protein
MLSEAAHRSLVFTSAGDHGNLAHWLRGERSFDLWVTYYGDVPGRYAAISDYYDERRGSKFGNLKFAYETWPEIFARYEAVLVMDDDILISASAINRLFQFRHEYDFWLLQPAFSPIGRTSWPLTRVHRQCVLRYTNFVEMTCPLFRRDKLDAFMAVYDPALVSYGTDWWFMSVLGEEIEGKVAVIDAIVCVNPHTRSKAGVREIRRLITKEQAQASWESISQEHGLSRRSNHEFGRVMKPLPARWLALSFQALVDGYVTARRWARTIGPLARTLRPAPERVAQQKRPRGDR